MLGGRLEAAACGILDHIVTNGSVYAITATASTIYLGGDFTEVGRRSGQGVGLDPTTGVKQVQWPEVAGTVQVVIGDGAGGWYIGGDFTTVGGVPRNRLAHILANGSLDASFDANMDGTVYSLALSGTTLYAGGISPRSVGRLVTTWRL
jgi:hypothetical protein